VYALAEVPALAVEEAEEVEEVNFTTETGCIKILKEHAQ
tara:strand:+ start:249 stop:365 length:117 start_codon:yes stop_codon:yes gene_type:complete